jgi:hypothetical protein
MTSGGGSRVAVADLHQIDTLHLGTKAIKATQSTFRNVTGSNTERARELRNRSVSTYAPPDAARP